jgi:hypothetical protein
MSKESTKKAFQKAFSAHMLLNLSQEEKDSIREYYGLESENFEQQLRSYPNLYKTYQRRKRIKDFIKRRSSRKGIL